jgi:hypothetical protein
VFDICPTVYGKNKPDGIGPIFDGQPKILAVRHRKQVPSFGGLRLIGTMRAASKIRLFL